MSDTNDFMDEFENAKEQAKLSIKYKREEDLLESEHYSIGTDEYGRWLFFRDKRTGEEVVLFPPLLGDHIISKVWIEEDGKSLSFSGWQGSATILFEDAFHPDNIRIA